MYLAGTVHEPASPASTRSMFLGSVIGACSPPILKDRDDGLRLGYRAACGRVSLSHVCPYSWEGIPFIQTRSVCKTQRDLLYRSRDEQEIPADADGMVLVNERL